MYLFKQLLWHFKDSNAHLNSYFYIADKHYILKYRVFKDKDF